MKMKAMIAMALLLALPVVSFGAKGKSKGASGNQSGLRMENFDKSVKPADDF